MASSSDNIAKKSRVHLSLDDIIENSKLSSKPSVPISVSPLERLCYLLTNIRVRDSLLQSKNSNAAGVLDEGGGQRVSDQKILSESSLRPIPTSFNSVNEYIGNFESHIVEEIKCNLVNSIAAISKPPLKYGRVVFQDTDRDYKNSVVNLSCEFQPVMPFQYKSGGNVNMEEIKKYIPAPMELVLFCDAPIPFPLSLETFNQNQIKFAFLAVIIRSNSRGGYKFVNAKTSVDMWSKYENFLIHKNRNKANGSGISNTSNSSNSSNSSNTNSNNGGSIFMNFCTTNSKSSSGSNDNNLSKSMTSSGPKHKSDPQIPSLTNISTQNSEKMKALSPSYHSFHFAVLDNLVSPWREFLALIDMGQTIQMIPSILCNNQATNNTSISTSSTVTSTTSIASGSSTVSNNSEVVLSNKRHSSEMNLDLSQPLDFNFPPKYEKMLKRSFNNSQYNAIVTAVNNDGFVLVQGPPGTGKTTTALGILNSIHLKEYNQFYEYSISVILSERGMNCRNSTTFTPLLSLIGELAVYKPHILVAAPTNVAVDNIIEKILEKGFVDGNGAKYNPSIIRTGTGKSEKVKSVSLEDVLAEEICAHGTDLERKNLLDSLQGNMREISRELFRIQGFLVNLKTAFLNHPLPKGWELKINQETGMPYWLDHNKRESSSVAPPAEGLEKAYKKKMKCYIGGQSWYNSIIYNGDFTLNSLPDFMTFTSVITQMLDQLDIMNSKSKRLRVLSEGISINDDSSRQALEISIIDRAHIVFTTLNSAGHQSLDSTKFRISLIDEAAQCVEPSILVALRRGCKKCIMIGDPMQLPSVLFSDENRRTGYDRSLFERLVCNNHKYTMLDTQYRMHAIISEFPSFAFYNGKLLDGTPQKLLDYCPKYIASCNPFLSFDVNRDINIRDSSHNHTANLIPPLLFFNLINSRDMMNNSTSFCNREEAAFVVNLIRFIRSEALKHNLNIGSIGVISPYSDQIAEIQRAIQSSDLSVAKSGSLKVDIELNTVDGFQGREKDIIIISTVRSNAQRNIGFLSDERRMNVALTRGKYGMYIVGNADTLYQHFQWAALIDHCVKRNLFCEFVDSSVDIIGDGIKSLYSRDRSTNSKRLETIMNSNETARTHHQKIIHESSSSEAKYTLSTIPEQSVPLPPQILIPVTDSKATGRNASFILKKSHDSEIEEGEEC